MTSSPRSDAEELCVIEIRASAPSAGNAPITKIYQSMLHTVRKLRNDCVGSQGISYLASTDTQNIITLFIVVY